MVTVPAVVALPAVVAVVAVLAFPTTPPVAVIAPVTPIVPATVLFPEIDIVPATDVFPPADTLKTEVPAVPGDRPDHTVNAPALSDPIPRLYVNPSLKCTTLDRPEVFDVSDATTPDVAESDPNATRGRVELVAVIVCVPVRAFAVPVFATPVSEVPDPVNVVAAIVPASVTVVDA